MSDQLTINDRPVVRGLPICMGVGPVYGRVIGVDGGQITMRTPGGSVLRSGCVWVKVLDEAGMTKLREFEAMSSPPYQGELTADELAIEP